MGGVGRERVLGGEEEGGGVRSRPGAARTILLFFIPLVIGLLNSLIEGASPRKSIALTKLRLRECTFSVVVTE